MLLGFAPFDAEIPLKTWLLALAFSTESQRGLNEVQHA
jgi:hypothetical protein